jgi:hypothetical protein
LQKGKEDIFVRNWDDFYIGALYALADSRLSLAGHGMNDPPRPEIHMTDGE